jgi:hypothetical protein
MLKSLNTNLFFSSIGFNGILQFCNLFVAGLIFYGFFRDELVNHPYLDDITLFLALLLCTQTHFALEAIKKKVDAFVLLLSFVIIFFYELRIFTLLLYPNSLVFERYFYGPADSNFALFFILVLNAFIYLGFYLVKPIKNKQPSKYSYGLNLNILIFVFVVAILNQTFPEWMLFTQYDSAISTIISTLYTPKNIWILLVIHSAIFWNNLSKKYILFLGLIGLLLLALQVLGFSRSAILTYCATLFIIALVVIPKGVFRIKHIAIIGILSIMLVLTSFYLYSVASQSRANKNILGGKIAEQIELFSSSGKAMVDNDFDTQIGDALARAGFFDFSAEIIANKDRYAEVFEANTYLKAIVDNNLSPGFDFFDQPRVASSLKYVYRNLGGISRVEEAGLSHSDQFGVYGEFFALFGWSSLLMALISAYLFKYVYVRSWGLDLLPLSLLRYSILYCFYIFINSFGLDWVLWDIVMIPLSFFAIYLTGIFAFRVFK